MQTEVTSQNAESLEGTLEATENSQGYFSISEATIINDGIIDIGLHAFLI